MYRIIEYRSEYRDCWDEYVKENGNIFHLINWKDVLEQTFGYKSLYLMVMDTDDNIVGLVPNPIRT